MHKAERFPWSRVSVENGAIELQKREVRRILDKDYPHLRCWDKACRKGLKRGQECYYPALGLSSGNTTVGHVECIDRICASVLGQPSNLAASLSELPATTSPVKLVPQPTVSVSQDPLSQLERIRQEIWNEGYQAGIADALARLTGRRDEGHDVRRA